jgi:two-component system, chemotaxis family, protein-glutamate methylesterase/glutaminase
MSQTVKIMIVDDSAVVRRMLTSALAKHSEIEIVGTATNGAVALSKIPLLNPEAIILDVEMPEMDGIQMLRALREDYPRVAVVMFSTLTERGANVTFDALAAGADDYVLKPSTQTGDTLESIVSNILVPKIIGLTRSRMGLALRAALSAAGADRAPNEPAPLGTGGAKTRTASLLAGANPFAQPSDSLAGKYTLRLSGQTSAPTSGNTRPMLGAAPPRPSFPAESTSQTASGVPNRPSSPSTGLRALAVTPTTIASRASALRTAQPVRGEPTASPAVRAPTGFALGKKAVQVIAIAASTGGPNALADVLERLPGKLPVPVVVVQHMPAIFTRCLAERLGSRCELKVLESQGGERIAAGHVYIAPGNRHLELVRDAEGVRTLLTDAPPENSCRPAADVTMRSLVRVYGGGVLGVVLTGMGQDGLRGSRDIIESGGRVVVQSGPTCVIWGMPKAVEEAGLAEAVVPLFDIAQAIVQRIGNGLLPLREPESRR